MALSVDYIEQAFQDAKQGRAAARPFSDGCIPTVFDKTLAPEGVHVMSLFTQWVPHGWSEAPHAEELEAYADRMIDCYAELAPNLKGAILHRDVVGPWQMEQEWGAGRGQHLPRRALGRAAVPHAPGPRLRRLPQPDRRPLPGQLGDPRRRWGLRHPRLAGLPGHSGRPSEGQAPEVSDPE